MTRTPRRPPGPIATAGGLLAAIVLGIMLGGSAVAVRLYTSHEIPTKEHMLRLNTAGVTLYDRNGQEFFQLHTPGRQEVVPLDQVPPHVRHAVIAAEDREFYEHTGFSLRGIARAAYLNLQSSELQFGGSTITQQVAKNLLLSPRKTFERKFRELVLAYKLENAFSKDDLLEMYLNLAYFGRGAYGIEAAAQTYFSKPARELTLAEGAVLAGLLPAPAQLSPTDADSRASRQRQQYVLTQMVEEGYSTAPAAAEAAAQPLTFRQEAPTTNNHAYHFALLVYRQLREHFTEEDMIRSGLQVTTTLDLAQQQAAETALQQHVNSLSRHSAGNGAAVVLEPATGEVRALVGSRGWNHPGFGRMNMAAAPRQTGSAFKPIVYAAALEQKIITPATILTDRPRTFGRDYRPENYDRRYRGRVPARLALANSLNVPAVEVVDRAGPAVAATLARQLGISSLSTDAPHNLSIALGTEEVSLLELTGAYGAFANQGRFSPPRLILAATDKHGQPIPLPRRAPRQAVSEETAFLITSMLSDQQARQRTFGRQLNLSRPAAVKTGTAQEYRNSWTVGYTPAVAVGVWIGNNDNTPMHAAPGAIVAAPLWRTLMEHAFTAQPHDALPSPPPSLVAHRVCRTHGLLAGRHTAGSYTEFFLPGTEPTKYCPAPTPPSPSPEPGDPPPAAGPADDKPEKDKKKPSPPKQAATEKSPPG